MRRFCHRGSGQGTELGSNRWFQSLAEGELQAARASLDSASWRFLGVSSDASGFGGKDTFYSVA
eukprot:3266417-Lingulodinium_polyedra.AAC.1